jgi:hypothetical protein
VESTSAFIMALSMLEIISNKQSPLIVRIMEIKFIKFKNAYHYFIILKANGQTLALLNRP